MKNYIKNFGQWLAENKKTSFVNKINESEENEIGLYGEAKEVTDYALYKYGVFLQEDSITKFTQNLTIKEFMAMDKEAQKYTIKNILLAYLPTGESLKGLGNVPQSSGSIKISGGEEEYDFSASDTELLLVDKNNFPFATIETKVTEGLNQHISQLPCGIIVNITKHDITLGGLMAKLKGSKDVKEFRDTANNQDFIKSGKTVFGELSGNVDSNLKSEEFKNYSLKKKEEVKKKDTDKSLAQMYLPTEILVDSLPTIKSAVNLAIEKMKAVEPDQAPVKK